MGTGFVTLKVEPPLGFVQLTRPPANACNLDVLKDRDAVVEEVRFRDEVKVLIVHGNPKFFSAGADITTFLGADPTAMTTFPPFGQQVLAQLGRPPQGVRTGGQ